MARFLYCLRGRRWIRVAIILPWAIPVVIRPEHEIPVDDAVGDVTATIEVYIVIIEPMGEEIFGDLVTSKDATVDMEDPSASGQILMSSGPDIQVAENQELSVVFEK